MTPTQRENLARWQFQKYIEQNSSVTRTPEQMLNLWNNYATQDAYRARADITFELAPCIDAATYLDAAPF